MTKKLNTLFILCTLALLTGCVSQEQADVKLSQGCRAALNVLIAPLEISEIKTQRYENETLPEGQHRRIHMNVIEADGWSEEEKEYSCLFSEQWGFARSSHNALFIQADLGDQVIGKKDGQILGDLEQFMKITQAVDAAINTP